MTRSGYLGQAGDVLPIVDGTVTLSFLGSGVQAVLLTVGDR